MDPEHRHDAWMAGERDLSRLVESLDPVVRPGEFVVVSVPDASGLPALATVHEAEGVSCVVERAEADERSLPYDFVAGWITLSVHSALDAIGLTAAVSSALASQGMSCNVIAGYYHDHLLVPHDRTEEACGVLMRIADPLR